MAHGHKAASAAALEFGQDVARKMLNRRGHGGAQGVVHRQMKHADLVALAAIAFDAGRRSIGTDDYRVAKNRSETKAFRNAPLKRLG